MDTHRASGVSPASGVSTQTGPQRLAPTVVNEIDRLLAGRTRDIRLNAELSRLFRMRSWPQTSKIIRAWMVWVVILDVLTLAVNAALLPSEAVMKMLLPASILPPAAIVTAIVFMKPRGLKMEALALHLGIFFILLSVALVGVTTGGEYYERHLTIMLFVAVTAIIIFPVPLCDRRLRARPLSRLSSPKPGYRRRECAGGRPLFRKRRDCDRRCAPDGRHPGAQDFPA